MILETNAIESYLNGNTDVLCGKWYYSLHPFSLPERTPELCEKIMLLWDEIANSLDAFTPVNPAIWNTLFPSYKEELETVVIDLIVGFPKPYDATTAIDSHDRFHLIFDLYCWSDYVGRCDIRSVVRNLLSHELCHVMIEKMLPDIGSVNTYMDKLDALTFNEGFAHLLSYNEQDIETVDWTSDSFAKVHLRSCEKMHKALCETDTLRKEAFLKEGTCGAYYDKFICMCGMLYFAQVWRCCGIEGLKNTLDKGFSGFAKKAAERHF